MHDIKINGAKNKLFDTKPVIQKLIDFASKEGFKIDKLEYNFVDLSLIHISEPTRPY